MTDFRHENHPGLEPGSRDLDANDEAPARGRGGVIVNETLNVTGRTPGVHAAYTAAVQHLKEARHA